MIPLWLCSLALGVSLLAGNDSSNEDYCPQSDETCTTYEVIHPGSGLGVLTPAELGNRDEYFCREADEGCTAWN